MFIRVQVTLAIKADGTIRIPSPLVQLVQGLTSAVNLEIELVHVTGNVNVSC